MSTHPALQDPPDPLDPTIVESPYSYYDLLRVTEPVHRVPGRGWFLVSSHALAVEVLMDPTRFSSSSGVAVPSGPDGQHPPEPNARLATLLRADPPVHAHYRSVVGGAFSVRRIAVMEAHVREIAEQLAAAMPDDAPFELGASFAIPLPLLVMCDLLGLPREMYPTFKRWSDGIARLGGMVTPEQQAEIVRDRADFAAYLQSEIAARRTEPRDDLTTDLVQTTFTAPDGVVRPLDDDELVSILRELVVAGNETTTNTITAGMLLLLQHPEQLDAVRRDHALIPNMVEEVLRLESPVQCHFRRTVHDTTLGGVHIPAGCGVGVIFGAANRDDAKFHDAARFDVQRYNARHHLAFGQGPHFCLGAALGRLELRIAFEVLLRRLGHVELADGRNELRHVASFTHRALRSLWLTVH